MSKIILLCHDVLGNKMAGPAIRYFEFANALSEKFEIVLLAPQAEILSSRFKVDLFNKDTLKKELKGATALITQQITPEIAYLAKSSGVKLILDAYDPYPIENLELFKDRSLAMRESTLDRNISSLLFSFSVADYTICASLHQKDLWLGSFLTLKKLTAADYDADPLCSQLIGIVPFGLSKTPPKKNGPGFREKFNLRKKDKIFVWGGGIWNWFDPLSLIHAMAELRKKRDDMHLVFMGIEHPNPNLPKMQMCQKAIALSKDLNLYNKNVHFNFGWIPYNERQNYLLDAEVGISTHFNNLETRYSFRTRMLDYLWAGLPMISTEGDFFADYIEKHALGVSVPAEDSFSLAKAIEDLGDNEEKRALFKRNIEQCKSQFYWENAVKPLEEYLECQTGPSLMVNKFQIQFELLRTLIKERGFKNLLKQAFSKITPS